jgi:hypothetical protein
VLGPAPQEDLVRSNHSGACVGCGGCLAVAALSGVLLGQLEALRCGYSADPFCVQAPRPDMSACTLARMDRDN